MNGPAQSYIPHGTTGWYTLAWQTIGHVFERTWHAELSSSGLRSAAVQAGVSGRAEVPAPFSQMQVALLRDT